MKTTKFGIGIGCMAIALLIGAAASAGQVGERAFVTLGNGTGVGTWTNNDYDFSAVKLLRLSVVDDLAAGNVVTVKRVIANGATSYTQTIGSVICASGAGTLAASEADGAFTSRAYVTLGNGTGVGTWSNSDTINPATLLTRISVVGNLEATNYVTASRLIANGATTYTQAVGGVTCAAGVGTQATLAYANLLAGDSLAFASAHPTGGTAIVEYTGNRAPAAFAYDIVKYGDVLEFSSSTATGGTAIVEYEVQKH